MGEIIEELSNSIKNITCNIIEKENNLYFYTIKRKTKDDEIVKESKKFTDLRKCRKARDKAVNDILEDIVDTGITKNANTGLYSFRATKLIYGKKHEITGKDIKFLKDARSSRQKAIDELNEKSKENSDIGKKRKMNVLQLLEEYLIVNDDYLGFSTQRLYRYNINSFNDFVKSKSICNIDVNNITDYLLKLKEQKYKECTIKNTKSKLMNIFQYAYERLYIKSNPVLGAMPVKRKKKDKRIKDKRKEQKKKVENIYTKEQFKEICSIIEKEDKDYLPFLYLSYYSGLRVSESSGLLYSNIKFKDKIIEIKHQLQRQNSMYCLIAPKSESGEREIPISDGLYTFLLDLKEKQKQDKQEQGIAYKAEKIVDKTGDKEVVKEDLDFVCKRANGLVIKGNATQLIKGYLCNYDEEKYKTFKLHNLRKTFASNIKDDVSILSLINIMGHSSIQITADSYLNETEDNKEKAKDVIKNL